MELNASLYTNANSADAAGAQGKDRCVRVTHRHISVDY